MKNITIYLYKLVILATSLVMVYFATGIASIAQSTELLKAEPIKHENFINLAQNDIALTFSSINIAHNSAQNNAKSMIAMQHKATDKDQKLTLNKALLVSE
tara:strand:+ start:1126 stop:1428 length:303 start_codon:yes stop_codon:yes gene_type:complete